MQTTAQLAIEKVAGWYDTSQRALNKCSIAVQQLIDELTRAGISDIQWIEVCEPIGSTQPHPCIADVHHVLRIGIEVADVTWAQIDVDADVPWKVYDSINALRLDWASIRDRASGELIAIDGDH